MHRPQGANLLLSKVDVSWRVLMKIQVEESKRSKQGIWPYLLIVEWRSRICFVKPNSANRGETNDNDHKVSWNTFTKECRIQLYILNKFVELYCWFTCHVLNKTYRRNTKKPDGPKYEKWMVIETSLVEFSIWWWSKNFGMSKIVKRT